MDIISHGLVGKFFQLISTTRNKKEKMTIVSFAILPDIPIFFIYILLGIEKERPFWIPHNSDWIGLRDAHPIWSACWELPHSALFLMLVIIPFVLYFKLHKVCIISYFLHIVLDIFTHTGEWAIKIFYPFDFMVNGFTEAWAWPIQYMILSWTLLIVSMLTYKLIVKKRTINYE